MGVGIFRKPDGMFLGVGAVSDWELDGFVGNFGHGFRLNSV